MRKVLMVILIISSSCSFAAIVFGTNTHEVKGYTKSTGVYVEPHMAGNPGSGVHCNGIGCY
jgi:hypothetical protein